jgi:hypothetical protein
MTNQRDAVEVIEADREAARKAGKKLNAWISRVIATASPPIEEHDHLYYRGSEKVGGSNINVAARTALRKTDPTDGGDA